MNSTLGTEIGKSCESEKLHTRCHGYDTFIPWLISNGNISVSGDAKDSFIKEIKGF